jgi:ketosteroid isomerase-like protein
MGTDASRALIREYLARVSAGDPRLPELLADDVEWWVPPGSKLGGTRTGKPAVLELLAGALALFSADHPPRIEVERIVAEGERVCVQFVLEARTAAGREYRNAYHLAFEVRGGRIARVKEYVDTAYANDVLLGG